jgi:hypothetical protein
MIRATHLMHIFGAGDPMKEVNFLEQEIRFSSMRQGDREFISTFKTRFDYQFRANEGAGIPMPTGRKLALEFIMKLDPKRYKQMLSEMRNDSQRRLEQHLAGPARIPHWKTILLTSPMHVLWPKPRTRKKVPAVKRRV